MESGYFTIFQTYFLHCTHVLYFLNSRPETLTEVPWEQGDALETVRIESARSREQRLLKARAIRFAQHKTAASTIAKQTCACMTNRWNYRQTGYTGFWFWRNAKASDWISRDPPWNVNSSTCWVMLGSVIGADVITCSELSYAISAHGKYRLSIIYYSTHWINCSIFM